MVSREHIFQTPLSEFRFLDSSYSRHKGFPQLSLTWQDGQPAEPCLDMLMAGALVERILLIWKGSQEKMLLVKPLTVLAMLLYPEAFGAVSHI